VITFDTPAAMRSWSAGERRAGRRVGLVPTMGALHEGHLSLVRIVRERCDACVVSIFVNPLQFGPTEDLSRYPRDDDGDRAKLQAGEVDVLYMPSAEAMYSEGFQTSVQVGRVTGGLCGKGRPGHFQGVTTVVAKLFNAVAPDVAVFGEKDYQQLVAVRRMTRDLDWGVEIVGGPIVREADGLAMSSRNAYLAPDERRAAQALSRSLDAARRACRSGQRDAVVLLDRVHAVLAEEPLLQLEYAALVDPETLDPVDRIGATALLALATRVGRTRLIDNTVLASA
jgi:pantoate--beta-alanine ligase